MDKHRLTYISFQQWVTLVTVTFLGLRGLFDNNSFLKDFCMLVMPNFLLISEVAYSGQALFTS